MTTNDANDEAPGDKSSSLADTTEFNVFLENGPLAAVTLIIIIM